MEGKRKGLLVNKSSNRDRDSVADVGHRELTGERRFVEDRNGGLDQHDPGHNEQTKHDLIAIGSDFAPQRED